MELSEGRLTGREDGKNRDGDKTVRLLQVEVSSAKDVQTVELVDTFGSESNPPDDSKVFHSGVGSAWQVALSVVDNTALQLEGKKGAKQKYSTNPAGTERIATITMDNDGTLTLTNSTNVSIILTSSGKISLINNDEDLLTLIKNLITEIKGIVTFGSPTTHTVSTASKTALDDVSDRFEDLLV